MKRRVVITGIGTNSALGSNPKELYKNLINKNYVINKIPEEFEKNYTYKSKYYVPAPKNSIENLNIEKKFNLLMSSASKLAVYSAYKALEDGNFKIDKKEKKFKVDKLDNCNVIIGVGLSDLQTAFNSHISHSYTNELTNTRFNRMVIPITMPNSVSAWISIFFGIKGINYTVNASCASGSYAIGQGYTNIINNTCDIAIVGGVESLKISEGSIMRGFDVLDTLTKSSDGIPRPFSDERSGFLFNEATSCVLILEELESAKRRNANIYAEIIDFCSNSDAYSIVEMNSNGVMIESLFDNIRNNNIKIDYLNTHGTGTILNDKIERNIILKVFGNKNTQPIINSTKGILGHSIGASGAIEAAVMAMSIKESIIHGNLLEEGFKDLNLNVDSIEKKINYAISTQYGFGGHNSMLLFRRYE
jgi:3-oxoacyl-[acyl-carrier-protein] synthase II